MLTLPTTTALLQVITSSAANLEVCASYVDFTAPTTFAAGGQNTLISSAVTTTVVGSPASSVKRNITDLSLRNTHASLSNTVEVKQTDGTTVVSLYKVTLAAGESCTRDEKGDWTVFDTTGLPKANPSTGRYLRTQTLTSGTTYTTGAGTTQIFARLQGGGGGGGGCTSVAAAAAAAGGGGGGSYAEKTFTVTPNTAYTIAIGAAGTGVSGAGGNNGGNTTLTVGGVTVTAPGGGGAPVATAVTTLVAYRGGAPGAISTNGDVNSSGAPGENGQTLIVATPIVSSGNGGNSNFGSGGQALVAVGNGGNATGFGSGGGGSATGASAVRTGGNGTAGLLIVDEYA